jgi:hypothetical protein
MRANRQSPTTNRQSRITSHQQPPMSDGRWAIWAGGEVVHLDLGSQTGIGGAHPAYPLCIQSSRSIRGSWLCHLLRLGCESCFGTPCWAGALRWRGAGGCPPPPPSPWVYLGLLVVQAVALRVPLSFCLGPRLVNAVSLRKQSGGLWLDGQAGKGSAVPGAGSASASARG